ncbi:hypothetical protein MN210_18580 [Psychrobacter raelei]|uniref:Uncharacterized protein n=1 Tax=Psychrobacter raelei TaxID=2565531 RepID=A0AAU6PTM6_9GAMM
MDGSRQQLPTLMNYSVDTSATAYNGETEAPQQMKMARAPSIPPATLTTPHQHDV